MEPPVGTGMQPLCRLRKLIRRGASWWRAREKIRRGVVRVVMGMVVGTWWWWKDVLHAARSDLAEGRENMDDGQETRLAQAQGGGIIQL